MDYQEKLDEKWICKSQINIDSDMIMCPICYQLIFQPLQCPKCQRLFCKLDTNHILKTTNQCPLCKTKPWKPSHQIHLSYRMILSKIKFKCQICHNNQQLSIKQLQQHLNNTHDINLGNKKIFYYYWFIDQDGNKIQFTQLQNLQIYHNMLRGYLKPKIQTDKYTRIVDLENNMVIDSIAGGRKLQRTRPKLPLNKQYILWCFEDDQKYHQFYPPSIINTIQNSYAQFLKNSNYNQSIFDIDQKRYRANFTKMIQVNTKTDFKRTIKRLTIKL